MDVTNPDEWLNKLRGISEETAAVMGIKTAMDGDPRVAFPYIDRNGTSVGYKIRAIGDKKFWFKPSGASRDLFNVQCLYDAALEDVPVIITEGEIDAASLVEAGFERVVSIPDGWTDGLVAGDTPKMKPILDNLDGLKKSPFVIVAGDNDATGWSFAKAVHNALDDHEVRVCRWPDGCKDPNDVLVQNGPSALVSFVNGAKPMDPEGALITDLSDLPPMPERTILRSGDPYLDELFRLELGTVNVVTGVPNHGKTTFAIWMLDMCARHHKTRVGAITFETHAYQLRDQLCKIESGRGYNFEDPKAIEAVRSATRYWRFVHPQEDDNVPFDMLWLKGVMRSLSVQHDCKILLLDPWNEVQHNIGKGETETLYTRDALATLRRWAKQYDMAVVIVAHPRKMDPKDDRPVQGYDISGSSTWYDKAFMGWTVQLSENEFGVEHTTLHAWKVKDRSAYGIRPGSGDFHFVALSGGFSPMQDAQFS